MGVSLLSEYIFFDNLKTLLYNPHKFIRQFVTILSLNKTRTFRMGSFCPFLFCMGADCAPFFCFRSTFYS